MLPEFDTTDLMVSVLACISALFSSTTGCVRLSRWQAHSAHACGVQYNWPGKSGNGDSLGPAAIRLHYPPLTFRAGTHLDTHLLSQGFSSCTTPVVRPACTGFCLCLRLTSAIMHLQTHMQDVLDVLAQKMRGPAHATC